MKSGNRKERRAMAAIQRNKRIPRSITSPENIAIVNAGARKLQFFYGACI